MTDISREEALAHFGVKGQKWGVRNERRANAAKNLVDSKKQKMERGKAARDAKKPIKVWPSAKAGKMSRKERQAALIERLNKSTEEAIADPSKLFALRQGNVTTVLSGKEFTDALIKSNGRLYVTDIIPVEIQKG